MTLASSWTARQGLWLDDESMAWLQRRLEIRRRAKVAEVAAVVIGFAGCFVVLEPRADYALTMASCLAIPALARLAGGTWRIRAERAVQPTGTRRYARPAQLRAAIALGSWYLAALATMATLAVGSTVLSFGAGRAGAPVVAATVVALTIGYSWWVIRRGLAVPAAGASANELAVDERLRTMAIREDLQPVEVQLAMMALLATAGPVDVAPAAVPPWLHAWLLAVLLVFGALQVAAVRWPWSRPLRDAVRDEWTHHRAVGGRR